MTHVTFDKIGVIEIKEVFAAKTLAEMLALNFPKKVEHINTNYGVIDIAQLLVMNGIRMVLSSMWKLEIRIER